MSVEIKLGDVVRLRKAHPCGSYEWEVVSVGTDIGLECLKCQRRVLLARDVFRRRVREFVPKSNQLASLTPTKNTRHSSCSEVTKHSIAG